MKKLFLTLAFSFICLFAYADTTTYYFNDWDLGEAWPTDADNMADGEENSYASTAENAVQLLDSNTCDGTDLGTISKVELRAKAAVFNVFSDYIYLRPVFSGGDGDNNDIGELDNDTWSGWLDITSDTNAPATWSWANVQALDCDVECVFGMFGGWCGMVEIRVTYTVGAAGVIKTYNGCAWSSVKTINGLPVGSVKILNGAAAQ